MDYGKLLKRGWEIVWNFKFLFLLGILSACGGNSISSGSNFNFNLPANFSSSSPSSNPFGLPDDNFEEFNRFMENFFENGQIDPTLVPEFAGTVFTIFLVASCILGLLFLIFFVIRQMAEAGMIKATYDIENGIKVDFAKAFSDGRRHWLSFFGQVLIVSVPQIIFLLVLAGLGGLLFARAAGGTSPETFMRDFFGLFFPVMICSICILVPYSIFIALIRPSGQRGVVLQEMGAWQGLKHGWQVLRDHPVDMILLGILYVVLGFIASIIIGIALAAILLATAVPLFFTLIGGETPGVFQIGLTAVGVLVVTIIGVLFNGFGVTYRSVTFTLAYMHFTGLRGMTDLDTTAKGSV